MSNKDKCEKNKKINYKYKHGIKSDIKYCVEWGELIKEVYQDLPINFNKSTVKKDKKFNKLYQNIDKHALLNTLKYLFYKIGGTQLFIMIKNNKLEKFVPFYNINYVNDWSDKIDDININKIFKKLDKNPYCIIKDKKKWKATGCLIRTTVCCDLSNWAVNIYKDLFQQLVEKRTIPDCYFFVSGKDFPFLNTDLTEPNYQIYGKGVKLPEKYRFKKFVPILGCSTTKGSAIIPIPTYDDWMLITKKTYPPSCVNHYLENNKIPWSKKINKAVFRGSATGCYTTKDKNKRLKLYEISKGRTDMNIGITKIVKKIKIMDNKLQYLNKSKIEISKPMSMSEQNKYKYIFDVEGNSVAFRFGYLLNTGSLILRVKCEWSLWIDNFLENKKEYIEIDENYDNLDPVMEWCKTHDNAVNKIVKNAEKTYKKYINEKFVFDYIEQILNQISRHIVN
jgi:hypothetical protein|tara:strand:- start:903 stop:2252 length:1350 start_codon:yes stop_codon:yes gene_type:complete